MRQGLILFADASPAGSPAEQAVVAAVGGALQIAGVTPFVAYGDPAASQRLRGLVGGPPPRFFPQATRSTLGERMAQAFAFLFVQDYDRVAMTVGGASALAAGCEAALAGLDDAPVVIVPAGAGYMVALRRPDFPTVAPIFEEVRWEAAGAKEAAEAILAKPA